jgi:hypothetical protein
MYPRTLAIGLSVALAVLLAGRSADLKAGAGRIVIAEGGKHRVVVVDRESRAIVNEKADFLRVDCLAQLSPDELVVCDGSEFVRVGLDLKERKRTPTSFKRVGSVSALSSNTLLVSDTDRHAVVSIDSLGNELSSIPVHFPSNVLRLPSGRLIVADGTPTLKVFEIDGRPNLEAPLRKWAASLDIARDTGEILVGESQGYERFDARYREQWFRPSKSRVSCIQNLPGGEVLLCEPDVHRVAIADQTGAIAWECSNLDYPWRALYIP